VSGGGTENITQLKKKNIFLLLKRNGEEGRIEKGGWYLFFV